METRVVTALLVRAQESQDLNPNTWALPVTQPLAVMFEAAATRMRPEPLCAAHFTTPSVVRARQRHCVFLLTRHGKQMSVDAAEKTVPSNPTLSILIVENRILILQSLVMVIMVGKAWEVMRTAKWFVAISLILSPGKKLLLPFQFRPIRDWMATYADVVMMFAQKKVKYCLPALMR